MQYTRTERREWADLLDGIRASVELHMRPYSAKAQAQFAESKRREWFTSEDLEALKGAAEILRDQPQAGGDQS